MKNRIILTVIFMFISGAADASDVVICRTSNNDNQQILSYLKSVDTPIYNQDPKNLINPNVSLLSSIPQKYWKCVNSGVVEMTQAEKDAVDLAEQQAANNARRAEIDKMEISTNDIIVALIKRINARLPQGQAITKQEIINQIKQDAGL